VTSQVLLNVTAFKTSKETDVDQLARAIDASFVTLRQLMEESE